jgi:hypothetical protein
LRFVTFIGNDAICKKWILFALLNVGKHHLFSLYDSVMHQQQQNVGKPAQNICL